MKKRTLVFLLLALVLSLSGCKKEEEPVEVSSLAVIEPESTEEFVDRLEDPTVSTLEIGEAPSAIYNIEGKQMDESEYFAYQESLQADEEKPTDSDGNNIPGGFANPLVETELSEDGSLADYKINEPAETQTEPSRWMKVNTLHIKRVYRLTKKSLLILTAITFLGDLQIL